MCNLYRMERAPDAIVAFARSLGQTVAFPEGVPNFQPRDVRITERAPILRRSEGLELVDRRWSWPAPTGKPVFNFRGEGRRFDPAERCVILADGFYEFTAPDDPKVRKKDRWLFTWPGHEWFGIAGLWRNDPSVGEAWTMLTCEPRTGRGALSQPAGRAAKSGGLFCLAGADRACVRLREAAAARIVGRQRSLAS